jgi:hypothetical protein
MAVYVWCAPAAQHVAAPERIKVVGELQRLFESGELCRWAAFSYWLRQHLEMVCWEALFTATRSEQSIVTLSNMLNCND